MLAFIHYVAEAGFGFLGQLEYKKPTGRQHFSDGVLKYRRGDSGKDWQRSLYTLLHLVPVGHVSLLNQQFQKWRAVYGKRSLRPSGSGNSEPGFADAAAAYTFTSAQSPSDYLDQLMHVLDLYLDMHDAKFQRIEGDDGLGSTGEIDAYFENAELAKTFFPDDPKSEAEGKLPIRGLREMLRFGGKEALDPICALNPITVAEAAAFRGLEDKVEDAQKSREALHDVWKDQKEAFGAVLDYNEAVAVVSKHRLLAARVRLTDHVTLYRLVMRVLGRLLDFACISCALSRSQSRAERCLKRRW